MQVVAHRGASRDAPEHTLAAYLRAIEDGADALECDVRLTRDGHLVCVHDRRVDRTSTGRGPVSTLELADLRTLDWGSWMERWDDLEDPEVADRDRSEVLTLRRLLEVVADAGRRVELAVETKHPTRWAGLVERALVDALARHGWHRRPRTGPPRVRVMSFAPTSLRRVRALAPAVPLVQLLERVPLHRRDGSLAPGVAAAGPSIELVRERPGYVARVHAAGRAVHVWTVDEPEDVLRCRDLGVDAVITNRPGLVLDVLGRR